METKVLLENIAKNYGRANNLFFDFLKSENYFTKNNLNVYDADFSVLRGMIYEFFEKQEIYVTVVPYEIKPILKWSYQIIIDGYEINDKYFSSKQFSEYVAFIKCFQFLDTRLIIEQNKYKYFDDSADSSLLRVNWTHLDKVLSHKRVNLL
jgi:hypothetical protein